MNLSVDDDDDLDHVDGLARSKVTDLLSESELIQPEDVNVHSVISAQATPVRTTEGRIKVIVHKRSICL